MTLNPYFKEPTAEEVARAAREQGVSREELSRRAARGEGWMLATAQDTPEAGRVELSADREPTVEEVEQFQKERGIEDFGEALRTLDYEQVERAGILAQAPPPMSEQDREQELRRLVDEKINNDPEGYVRD